MDFHTRNYSFDQLVSHIGTRHSRQQLASLYDIARSYEGPNIVELGTKAGQSATIFLKACHETGGRLVSVDIKDFSDISDDERFHFVLSDSSDVDAILAQKPFLRKGIDLLYVDSLHTAEHVEKETRAWWPYLKAGATIAYDDVDPSIYRKGQRKDHPGNEREWTRIFDFVQSVFLGDEDDLDMRVLYGSTGLAILTKHSPLGSPLSEPAVTQKRGTVGVYRDLALRRLGRLMAVAKPLVSHLVRR